MMRRLFKGAINKLLGKTETTHQCVEAGMLFLHDPCDDARHFPPKMWDCVPGNYQYRCPRCDSLTLVHYKAAD